MTHKKLIILGSGPAGYTAAIYASRAMLSPLVLAGSVPGGQLTITTEVENYPGFLETTGPELMEVMREQALKNGAEVEFEHVVETRIDQAPFHLVTESGKEYTCDSLIISTGAEAKWLGLPTEKKFMGFGVSACATCDGFFFRNKVVCVIGGGNTACEEALYLANLCSKVYLIHRRDSFRSEKILQNRVFENDKIEVVWNHNLSEIHGEENQTGVTGVTLISTSDNSPKKLDVDGVFIAIGHKPNTDIFRKWLDLDEEGYLVCKPGTVRTKIPGVYAAGDVQDKIYRQAVTAAGQGCMAALEAEKYLSGISH